MKNSLRNQPLFVILMGLTSLSMLVPTLFAMRLEQWLFARTFFYHSIVLFLLSTLVAISLANRELSNRTANRLLDIFAAFFIMPAFMALPMDYLVPQFGFGAIYFEMISCFTTTGASIFDVHNNIPDVIHFWRGFVGWQGGFLMLVVAMSIFMPINIGGFEVYTQNKHGQILAQKIKRAAIRDRLIRFSAVIFPIYAMLTGILALLLIMGGDRLLVGVVHAMSIMSTSGISPIGGLQQASSGLFGEILMFLFMFFAISRHMFLFNKDTQIRRIITQDREMNMALILLILIPSILFFRHWAAANEVNEGAQLSLALSALWGSMFTVMSFLTTTGFESVSWSASRDWSGLGTSGLILMGLAVMGGGIATTAGGVKLLRVYALYKHGLREMQRLSYPSSVGGHGSRARSIRREGAYAAWIFFMLFLLSIALGMLFLSMTGIDFDDSLILAIASLSNTGPLLATAGDNNLSYAQISTLGQAILCALMVLGRLEALAVIAILNPNYWRK